VNRAMRTPGLGAMTRGGMVLAATAVLVCVVGACGVPGSGDFRRIDPDNLPSVLAETTTTTTTSLPTTAPPEPTVAPTAPPSSTSTTTTTEAPTTSTTPVFDVALYFVAGPDSLTPITRQLASRDPGPVLTALTDGVPAGDEYAGLRTAILPGTLLTVSVTAGTATVELPPNFITDTPPTDQPLAIGQIVLTLVGRPGIGQVRFTSNNEPRGVQRADGSLTNPGDAVACEDYRVLAPLAGCG
jgi:spore germination protein GerM